MIQASSVLHHQQEDLGHDLPLPQVSDLVEDRAGDEPDQDDGHPVDGEEGEHDVQDAT